MLRVSQQSAPAAAKQYYAAADYYAEGRETAGVWRGRGAELLGLAGTVGKAEFDRLCDNRHPTLDRPLTARTKDDRTVGYDFTWSVPKSVSLYHALTGDERVVDAFRAAVGETMADVEAEIKTRVRRRGRAEDRVTGNMVWAEFVHHTSRPVGGVPDPHLHAHCFVFNATRDGTEGAWKAGQFRDLKRDAPYFQAAFRARLADRLQDLGLAVERTRDDFELAGATPAVLRRFSRRTAAIEALAAERGVTDPDRKAELGALTRERKGHALSWAELRREWAARLSDAEAAGLVGAGSGSRAARGPDRDAAAVDFALRHAFERAAVVPEKQLLADALRFGLGAVTVAGVRRELARAPVLTREEEGRRLVTTHAVLAEEERMLAFARDGRGTLRPLGAGVPDIPGEGLNAGQRRAVAHILNSRDRVTVVRGAAGTGKTTMMRAAVRAIAAGGHRVVPLAPSAGASRDVLRRDGFAGADTVAAFLRGDALQRAAAGQVIWVDEAGLLGSKDVTALFDAAARLDARLILTGDERQHGSVARGAPLRLLRTRAGLPAAELTEVVRQGGDYKRAVELLSRGRAAAGLDALDRLGWVREVAGGERYLALAEAYLECAGRHTALVVSPTHAEGALVTAAIRDRLRAAGGLADERVFATWRPLHLTEAERGVPESYRPGDMIRFHTPARGHPAGSRVVLAEGAGLPLGHPDRFEAYRPDALAVAAGDRVRVTAGGRTADGRHRLNTGDLFTVAGFTARGDLVVDTGWVIGRDFGHLAHGYAVTSHAAQGKTVDTVLIGQSGLSAGATTREQFYVSVSRGRRQAVVFTDDKAALRDAVGRAEGKLAASDLAWDRPPARLKAHLAFMRRLLAGAYAARDLGPARPREAGYAR